jgi:hypothetical protein
LRSYKAVVAAVVLALVLLAPILGQMAKAAAYPQPGTGIVYTKLVSVGGAVTFDFNLTPAYQGAAARIYLSANGLPSVYYGDVPITPAFSTTNVTAVVGSWPITATAVANFMSALSTYGPKEDGLSNGATQETTVLHNLTTQGWALVYLKYSTSAPVEYGGSAPAIAAGPFNLTIRPTMKVTIKPLNNLSYASLCLPTSSEAFLNITGTNAYTSGIIKAFVSGITSYNFQLLGSYANSTVTTEPVVIAAGTLTSVVSNILTSVQVNHTATPPSIGVYGFLDPAFPPPALTNSVRFSSGAVASYFNISNFNLLINSSTSVTVVPANGTTYVEFFPSGTYVYGITTGKAAAVTFYPIIYSLSNYGVNPSTLKPYGLFTPSPAAGTLNIFPSFKVTNENPGVAGPSDQLNPGDELTLNFYNLPSGTSFMAVTAIGNGTLLPTSPYLYPAEENSESYYTTSGYYVAGVGTFANNSFTYIVSTTGGEAIVDVLIPNAPYYPVAKLGLEYEITYTPKLVSGTISPYAYVSNCTLWYSGAPLVVYPFYQVFTSNANGMFYFNGTSTTPEVLLFGNYLLVRGFGFSTSISSSEYPVIMNSTTAPIAATTLAPITSVQTDGYGDFAYISQVPISGSFYNFLVTKIPPAGFTKVPAYVPMSNASSGYSVYLSANPKSAIVYVDPMPVVYPPTPIVTGLLGEIQMPTTLFKYPFEATQYMINGTTYLIPAFKGMIHEIVVVGAGANANITTGKYGSVLLKFYIEGYETDYFGSVNVSQVAPFGDSGFSGKWVLGGYGVFYNVPVPDLAGNAGWMPSGKYPYEIAITNVTSLPGAGESGPAYTTLYVGKAADLLIGTYSLAYMLTNSTTGAAVFYVSPLVTQPILVLPGTPVTVYVFGSPISKPTGKALPVNVSLLPPCGTSRVVPVGYIINGTLFSNFTGKYVKGSHLTAGTTLPLCSGLNVLSGQITGPYVPTGTTVTYSSTPVSLYLNYVSVIPAYPVQFTLTAPGSVSAGTALEVLASSQVSVMGLPAYQVSPFFIVSAPTVTAYVVTSSGVVKQLPVSLLTTVNGYYVYLVSVPSNASGTLIVEATVTATYRFTGQQFVGQQAAAVGILSPINTTAISNIVSRAVKEIEANVTGEIGLVMSNMANYYGLLSLQLAATQQRLAYYIAGNASALQTALSLLGVQLSGQVTTAQQTLAGYMAGNFSAVLTYLSNIKSTLSTFSSVVSQLSAIASSLEGVASQLSSINAYMASNFSAIESSLSSISSQLKSISSGISTLQGNLVALGAEVGSIGANVLELTKSVNTLTSYGTAALNYLTSMNSTLGSMSSQLSSVSSTVSSVSSTVSSISSTLSGMSSSLGTISSDLSTIGSDLSSISGTLSSMSGTLSSVSSTLTSISSTLTSMSSTLSSTSSTASNAYSEATHAAQLAASAATYSLAALIVAIIALALIAYVGLRQDVSFPNLT